MSDDVLRRNRVTGSNIINEPNQSCVFCIRIVEIFAAHQLDSNAKIVTTSVNMPLS